MPFGFDLLGGEGLGLTGAENKSKQTTQLDPTTLALNRFRLGQLENATIGSGGLGNLFAELRQYGMLYPQTQDYLNRATNAAFTPGLSSGDWYGRTVGGLNYFPQANATASIYGDLGNQLSGYYGSAGENLNQYYGNAGSTLGAGYGNLSQNVGNFYGGANNALGQYFNAVNAGINSFANPNFRTFDPNTSLAGLENQLLQAGGNYYRDILGPQVGSQNALMGLARSGANTEAQARAATSISLPIAQQLADYRNQLQQQANTIGTQQSMQQNQLLAGLTEQQRAMLAQNWAQGGQAQQAMLGAQGQALGGIGLAGADAQRAMLLAGGGARESIYGQTGQALGNVGLANAAYQGGLGQQYLQNLYEANAALPANDINLANAQLARMGQGVNFSDYARQTGLGVLGQGLSGYLSAFNATPYTPAGTVSQTGTNNQGLLNTSAAGTAAGGIGAIAKSDIHSKKHIKRFDSRKVLDKILPYTFEYKNPVKHGFGSQVGVMAHALRGNSETERALQLKSDGFYIDYAKLLPFMFACIVDLHHRLREVEDAQ